MRDPNPHVHEPVGRAPSPLGEERPRPLRARVRSLLSRSLAYQSLRPARRARIADDLTKVAHYLAGGETRYGLTPGVADGRVTRTAMLPFKDESRWLSADVVAVQRPACRDLAGHVVLDLLEALATSSAGQMEAFASLLDEAASIVDSQVSVRLPGEAPPCERPSGSACRDASPVEMRRFLMAKVLMGINRIVVTDGRAPS